MGEWVSPINYGGVWYSEPTNSYDGNTGTYTTLTRENGFILYPASFILCSKIRLWTSVLTMTKANVTISVYYSGSYHEIYSGYIYIHGLIGQR